MITECPTCNRRSIVCTHCGRLATDDNEGRLPRWCSGCGAMLAESPAASRHESLLFAANEIVHSAMSGRMRPRTHLIVFAIVCGIVASVMTFGLLSPPKETPPGPRIYRETYSVQLPEKQWEFEPNRWESECADLVVEGTFRGGKGMLLMVHVIHPQADPLTLDALVEQTRQQWLQQMPHCVFLPDDGGSTKVAGEEAVRLIAITEPYCRSGWDHLQGYRSRREAILLVHEDLGYRLTAEELDVCFDRVQERFKKFVASFRAGPSH